MEVLDQVSVPLVRFLHQRHQDVFLSLLATQLDSVLRIGPEAVCRQRSGFSARNGQLKPRGCMNWVSEKKSVRFSALHRAGVRFRVQGSGFRATLRCAALHQPEFRGTFFMLYYVLSVIKV